MTPERTVLITGATSGLGLHAAHALAASPGEHRWHLVLTGRDEPKLTEAATALGATALGATALGATAMRLDLSSLADVRQFAAELPRRGLPPLGAIVCNAGIQVARGLSHTVDGFEATFAVNHLGHFLLVNLLLSSLTDGGRIVLVASDTHDPRRPTGMPAPRYTDPERLARPESSAEEQTPRSARRRYTTSKLCNVLTAYELARRLTGAGSAISANAFDPGLMPGTGLAREYRGFAAFGWRYVLPALTVLPGLNVHTPARSGAALARLVDDPALAGVSGRYFSGRREIRSSDESYDRDKAAELWRASAELVGIDAEVR